MFEDMPGLGQTRLCGDEHPHNKHAHKNMGWNYFCPGWPEPGDQDEPITSREAADHFMRRCGLDPTPDAIGQLSEAFLPCLKIMCERGYDPDGKTWHNDGWRGLIEKASDKMERLMFRGWTRGIFQEDDPLDGINYLGFYFRMRKEGGSEWGKKGPPGNA